MTPDQVRRQHRSDEVDAAKSGQLEPGRRARLARAGATRGQGARAANEQGRVAPAPEGERHQNARRHIVTLAVLARRTGAVAFAYSD